MDKQKDIILDYEKLSERCDEINVKKQNALVREITLALKDTMKEHDYLYLCANQIGYNNRIFVIKFGEEYKTFINPMITKVQNITMQYETCNSIPGKTFVRPRHQSIFATYQTPLGDIESKQFLGMAAIIFQHCVDHLDGLLLSDVGLEIDEKFTNASDKQKEKILKMYMESLDTRQKDLKEIIESDEQLTKINDAIKFMEEVATGKTTIKKEPITIKEEKEDGVQ